MVAPLPATSSGERLHSPPQARPPLPDGRTLEQRSADAAVSSGSARPASPSSAGLAADTKE